MRIVEDGQLRADLVFDHSKLNTERIRVVWLSPNDWHNAGGFRYGNIAFQFDWDPIVAGKKYYWVESIAYGIPACRILVTDADYAGRLDPYDPAADDGPWKVLPDGRHFWNGEACLEVMVEGDVDLACMGGIEFVRHHDKRCNIDTKHCPYLGASAAMGGAQFVGRLISRGADLALPGLVSKAASVAKATATLAGASGLLVAQVGRLKPDGWGGIGRVDAQARSLACAILGALTNGSRVADATALASLFRNSGEMVDAVKDAIASSAGLAAGADLFDV